MRSGKRKGYGLFAIVLIVGAVVGGIIGELIAQLDFFTDIAPYLVRNYAMLDIPPVTINLYVLKVIVGFSLQPNIMSVAGVLLAVLLFRRF